MKKWLLHVGVLLVKHFRSVIRSTKNKLLFVIVPLVIVAFLFSMGKAFERLLGDYLYNSELEPNFHVLGSNIPKCISRSDGQPCYSLAFAPNTLEAIQVVDLVK